MSNDEPQAPRESGAWGFGDFELDAAQRVLTRGGSPVRLSIRAFGVLRYLVRHHPRTIPRAELLAHCWPEREVTEGAVARIMMSLRTALGDTDPQHGPICTVPRVGYRFAMPVRALAATPLLPATVRLAVLPVDNRSTDPRLAWAGLGLASLLGARLAQWHVGPLASVRQVLVALEALPPQVRADTHLCARAIARSLGAQAVLGTRLSQQQGSCMLELTLHGDGVVLRQGCVLADDAAEAAQRAAGVVARWLAPAGDTAGHLLGDAFLDEAWQRALRHVDDGCLPQAEHLLDLLRDAGADTPGIDLEQARVALLLGRPHAPQALQRLEARVARSGDPQWRVEVLLLQAQHRDLLGHAMPALAVSREAATLATGERLADLPLRAAVACARRTIDAGVGGAREMLAPAMRRVETGGDRLLLRDACVALGDAAAADEDWLAAGRHHALGLAAAQTLHESARAAPLRGLSQVRLQSGGLGEARALAVEALRCARLGGVQPAQGHAALAVAAALRARRETDALRELLSMLDALADDRSAAMDVARESRCRAALLSLAGRHDDALACIAQARHGSRKHPALAAICLQDRLQVLLVARRLDDVQALCAPLLAARGAGCLDQRVLAWIELAMGCCEHALQADPAIAQRRLDALQAHGPPSQARAMAGLAAAWIDLQAGRIAPAAARLASLQAWTAQCPVGRRVAARADGTTNLRDDTRDDLIQLLWQAA